MFLDQKANLILDPRNIGDVRGTRSAGDLIVFKTLPFIVTRRTKAL